MNELLAPAVGEDLRPHLSFELGPGAVREIAGQLAWWLSFIADTPKDWRRAREDLTDFACAEFGWEEIASSVAAVAQGQLAGLLPVPAG